MIRRAGRPDARTLAVFWFPADPQPAGDLLDCTLELGTAAATGAHLVVGIDPGFAGGSRIRERLASQRPEVEVHRSRSETLQAASRLFAELLDPIGE